VIDDYFLVLLFFVGEIPRSGIRAFRVQWRVFIPVEQISLETIYSFG